MAGAMLALLVASATVLGLGQGLRRLVDDGFKSGDAATLDRGVLVLIGVVVLLAGSTFCRFYLVCQPTSGTGPSYCLTGGCY